MIGYPKFDPSALLALLLADQVCELLMPGQQMIHFGTLSGVVPNLFLKLNLLSRKSGNHLKCLFIMCD